MVTDRFCKGPSLVGASTASTNSTNHPPPAVAAVCESTLSAAAGSASDQNAPDPNWWATYAMMGLAVATFIVVLLSFLSVSSSYTSLRGISDTLKHHHENIDEALQAAAITRKGMGSPPGGAAAIPGGIGASPLWDYVDAALQSAASISLESGDALTSSGSSSSSSDHREVRVAAQFGKSQMQLIARQEALYGKTVSAVVELRERLSILESNYDWLWVMWVVQFVVILVVTFRMFIV